MTTHATTHVSPQTVGHVHVFCGFVTSWGSAGQAPPQVASVGQTGQDPPQVAEHTGQESPHVAQLPPKAGCEFPPPGLIVILMSISKPSPPGEFVTDTCGIPGLRGGVIAGLLGLFASSLISFSSGCKKIESRTPKTGKSTVRDSLTDRALYPERVAPSRVGAAFFDIISAKTLTFRNDWTDSTLPLRIFSKKVNPKWPSRDSKNDLN